jgi:hypothetical protein
MMMDSSIEVAMSVPFLGSVEVGRFGCALDRWRAAQPGPAFGLGTVQARQVLQDPGPLFAKGQGIIWRQARAQGIQEGIRSRRTFA